MGPASARAEGKTEDLPLIHRARQNPLRISSWASFMVALSSGNLNAVLAVEQHLYANDAKHGSLALSVLLTQRITY